MSENSLVPELAVTNWELSQSFYCDLVGFDVVYERPEEGFCFLALDGAQLMLDQIGVGRTFDITGAPFEHPLGRGINLQIRVPDIASVEQRLTAAGLPLYLPLEERWYRRGGNELGNWQLVVADPDGYLLRLFQDLGERPAG